MKYSQPCGHNLLTDIDPDNGKLSKKFSDGYGKNKISNYLFLLRTKSGVSQTDMAKRLGVSQRVIAKMENNGDSLKFNDVIKYANALGFSPELNFLKTGRMADFLAYHFSRIPQIVDELLSLAGNDEDISFGVFKAFGDYDRSMAANVLPKFQTHMNNVGGNTEPLSLRISMDLPINENPEIKSRKSRREN